jgi:hypothetical protein
MHVKEEEQIPRDTPFNKPSTVDIWRHYEFIILAISKATLSLNSKTCNLPLKST